MLLLRTVLAGFTRRGASQSQYKFLLGRNTTSPKMTFRSDVQGLWLANATISGTPAGERFSHGRLASKGGRHRMEQRGWRVIGTAQAKLSLPSRPHSSVRKTEHHRHSKFGSSLPLALLAAPGRPTGWARTPLRSMPARRPTYAVRAHTERCLSKSILKLFKPLMTRDAPQNSRNNTRQ